MKKFLLPVIFVVVGLGVGIGGVLGAAAATGALGGKSGEASGAGGRGANDHGTAGKAPAGDHGTGGTAAGFMLPTRERIVNLADQGTMRYLKTTIVLELLDPAGKLTVPKTGEEYKKKQEELAKELKGPLTVIDDQITLVLTAKASSELMSPEGKQRLRDELRERLQKSLHEFRIANVYFTDFIIQ